MFMRYYIRKGDRTTAGGTVTEGSAVMHCDGLPLAFEGDAVSCPSCHSTGKIMCDGPRWPKAGPDGRQTALSDGSLSVPMQSIAAAHRFAKHNVNVDGGLAGRPSRAAGHGPCVCA